MNNFPFDLNTVIVGDCLDILPLLPDGCVDLVVTSPPYNVGVNYGPLVNDSRPWDEYYTWLGSVLAELYRVLKSGGVLTLNVPKEVKLPKDKIAVYGQRVQKIATIVDEICHQLGYLPRESIVWAKGNEGLPISSTSKTGSDNNIYMRAVSEMILLYSKDRYYVEGGTGRRGMDDVPWQEETKDVWWIPSSGRNGGHPCPFPAEIPRRLIDLFSRPRPEKGFIPLVLDPFAGSGKVGVVARQMGRNFFGIEINPEFAAAANEQIAAAEPNLNGKITSKTSLLGGRTVTTIQLPLAAITIDPTLNIREALDEATVRQYMDIYDRLPPAVVYRLEDGTYLLASGFHRLEAAQRLGRAEVAVEVREGSRRQAREFAILDNLTHGRPYSRAERRKAIEEWLKLYPERADSWIAADLCVSSHTVRAVREGLEATSQIAKLDRLMGADGKERPRELDRREDEETTEVQAAAPVAPAAYSEEEGATFGPLPFPQAAQPASFFAEEEAEPQALEAEAQAGETLAAGSLLQLADIPGADTVNLSDVLLLETNSVHIPLPDESVHCVAFSPPYWALRRYDGDGQVFVWPGMEYRMPGGLITFPGDLTCEHEWQEHIQPARQGAVGDKSTLGSTGTATQLAARFYTGRDNRNGIGSVTLGQADRYNENLRDTARGGQPVVTHFCARCGAIKCALGLEPDVDMYIGHLLLILREVRRVLRKDGTLWLNLGFSYYGSGQGPGGSDKQNSVRGSTAADLARFKTGRNLKKSNRYRLRQNLTDEQRAYVFSELAKARAISSTAQDR